MKTKLLLSTLFASFLLTSNLSAQNPTFEWAKQMGGTSSATGTAMAMDSSGSIYIIGNFYQTVDFDPGPNTFNLTSYSYDSYLLKWNQTTVGIKENTFIENIQVYPNPTDGNFAIKFETMQKDLSVRIMSISGQNIETHTFQNTDFVQLRLNQPDGIYLIDVLNEKGNKTKFKII